jgi:hypothetical protein
MGQGNPRRPRAIFLLLCLAHLRILACLLSPFIIKLAA